ncbi:MAG: hypothetical protein WC683_04350 [bacterium]
MRRPAFRSHYFPAFYSFYYTALAATARRYGYALALHGSMQRDLDMIAVPWTDKAVSAERLIEVLRTRHGLFKGQPAGAKMPHGRRCWSLMFGGHAYADISVLPRRKAKAESKTWADKNLYANDFRNKQEPAKRRGKK